MLSVPGALESYAAESVFERASCGSSFKMGRTDLLNAHKLEASVGLLSARTMATSTSVSKSRHCRRTVSGMRSTLLRLAPIAAEVCCEGGRLSCREGTCLHASLESVTSRSQHQAA